MSPPFAAVLFLKTVTFARPKQLQVALIVPNIEERFVSFPIRINPSKERGVLPKKLLVDDGSAGPVRCPCRA